MNRNAAIILTNSYGTIKENHKGKFILSGGTTGVVFNERQELFKALKTVLQIEDSIKRNTLAEAFDNISFDDFGKTGIIVY